MAKLDHAPNNFRGLMPLVPTLTPIPGLKAPVKPSKGLLEGMDYTPARFTNVRETWRRFGYKPPSEGKA